jgi:replicative DNA helicase
VIDLIAKTEALVLGAAMADRACRSVVLGTLSRDDFSSPELGALLVALKAFAEADGRVDWDSLVRVGDRRLLGLVDAREVALSGRGKTPEQVAGHCRAIRTWSADRTLRARLSGLVERADLPTDKLIAEAKDALNAAQSRATTSSFSDGFACVDELWSFLEGKSKGGLYCGLEELDDITDGFQPGLFYVAAARPSVGKSAFGVSLIAGALERNLSERVVFVSVEMTRREITTRLVAQMSGVPSLRIRRKLLSEDETSSVIEAGNRIAQSGFLINDVPALRVGDLEAMLQVEHARLPVSLVVVDYLQKLRPNVARDSREREVSEISESLAEMAKRIGVPVVALAQISRAGADEPKMQHLRESGSIENDANTIFIIDRPGVRDPSATTSKEVASIDVAKNRDGETRKIFARYCLETTRFVNEPAEWKEQRRAPSPQIRRAR